MESAKDATNAVKNTVYTIGRKGDEKLFSAENKSPEKVDDKEPEKSESVEASSGAVNGAVEDDTPTMERAKSLVDSLGKLATMTHSKEDGVFHERQRLQLCLLHALNNLLQREAPFSRKELDGIADDLPSIDGGEAKWWSPLSMVYKRHRNSVTGDYDVNVLFAALATRGKEVIWYDRRKGADGLSPEVATYGSRLVGIILNVPARRFGGLWKGRHWVAVRMIKGQWYNLDSDLAEPVLFHNGEEDLTRFVDFAFLNAGEVLIVVDAVDNAVDSS